MITQFLKYVEQKTLKKSAAKNPNVSRRRGWINQENAYRNF